MNTLTLASLPVFAAALLSTQSPAPVAPADEAEITPVSFVPEPIRAGTGLGPHRTLQTGSLQMGTGIQSASRGLTPDAEWRAMFPAKPGTR